MARGGKRDNAGRKSVATEQRANELILSALKVLYKVDDDNEAKIELVKKLMESQRGQIFIAEHLLGKPKETIDQNLTFSDFNIKDLVKFK